MQQHWHDLTIDEQRALKTLCGQSFSPITLAGVYDLKSKGLADSVLCFAFVTEYGRDVYLARAIAKPIGKHHC